MRKSLLIVVLAFLITRISAQLANQSASISLTPILKNSPFDCNENEYFDSIDLICKSCPANSQTLNTDSKYTLMK